MRIKLKTPFYLIVAFISTFSLQAQREMTINAQLLEDTKSIHLDHKILISNTSDVEWEAIYFIDWAHSFSSKTTPLAKRFAEYFEKKFHLAPDEDRGFTSIKSITANNLDLKFERPEKSPDILKVLLQETLKPGETVEIDLDYTVTLPDAKFTDYGVTKKGDYNLRYWFLTPAVFDDGWVYYSNKNLNDRYFPQTNININFSFPEKYTLVTDLEQQQNFSTNIQGKKLLTLTGDNRTDVKIFLLKESSYQEVQTDFVKIVSNLHDHKVPSQLRALVSDRIAGFLHENLGTYPFSKILITHLDYKEQPVYGLNELPDFISPFPDGFQYEIEMLKTTINNYVNNTLLVNPRNDRWVIDGIKVFLLQNYMDTYYPDLKVVGNFDRYWLVRQFYASKLEFNDQFSILSNHISRLNLEQSLDTPYDRLIRYNKNIGFSYKSGVGLNYLNDYLGSEAVENTIKVYYQRHNNQPTSSKDFENLLRQKATKDVDWFFEDYITSNRRIDYTIKNSRVLGDSILVKVRNNSKRTSPIPIYAFKNDSIISKKWINGLEKSQVFTYPKDSVDRFVLNYEQIVPESNLRNNYEKTGSFLNIDKPIELKIFQDFENPSRNQLFFMPVFEYNLYDGFAPGLKIYNKTLLRKSLDYKLEPQFGLNSKKLLGSASISYRHDFQNQGLYLLRYGISGSTFSYAENLRYDRITPFVSLNFRTSDLRADKRQSISARYISVQREEDPLLPLETPNYDVLNLRYVRSNPGIINTLNWNADIQFGRNFGKASITAFYRRLFLNNRQLNLRVFGGAFTYNNTEADGDFFSFALDRPTDYLFDYNYYGRSEDSGVFSQQIIIAEGGFKSQLEPAFANQFLMTANASTTIWKYFYAYGDVGFVKNKGINGRVVFDSGIQVSLLDDYFELYFPVYSNLGWEIAQPDYDQKIRFTVQIGINTVIGLFSRKWY